MIDTPLAVFLDMDGTLVDSEPGILASAHATLRGLGHDPTGLELTALIGPPLEDVMERLLARFGDDRVAEAVVGYRAHYGEAGYLETTAYPGIADALDGLVGLGARLFVATSKRRVFAQRIVEHQGLADRFTAVHGSEPGGAIDKKADLIAHILAQHGLDPGRCVMVGDRREDVLGAQANGVRSVGVLWGYGSREELEGAGAGRIIAEPAELVGIVGS